MGQPLGRPMRYGSHIVPVSCSLPRAWIRALDTAAQERQFERIQLLREIIGTWLADNHPAAPSHAHNGEESIPRGD